MSIGLASLHKVLKDETRRKIIQLLREKGSLTYIDLMNLLNIASTGKLNYHLKTLNGLILKEANGQYILTEKGMLASRLLVEFPEENRHELGLKPKWWRRFWIGTAIVSIFSIIASFGVYFAGYMDLTGLYQSMISLAGAIGIAYMIAHITRDVLSKKTQLLVNKIAYTMLGAGLGWIAAFFGGLIVFDVFALYLGGLPADWTAWLWIFSLIFVSVIGGIAGYRFGKRRGFKRPEPKFLPM